MEEVGLLGLLKFIVYCLLFTALVGKFFTGSFLFNYEEHLPSLKKLWPVSVTCSVHPVKTMTSDVPYQTNERLFTEEGLLKFDGTDPTKPIYLAVRVLLRFEKLISDEEAPDRRESV